MADTAALVVALSAQLTKFEKDMKGAVDIARKRTQEIENTFAKMNKAINAQLSNFASGLAGNIGGLGSVLTRIGPAGLAAGAGLGAAALAMFQLVDATEKYVEELGRLKDAGETIGVTATQLKALERVGQEVGLSGQEINTFLVRFVAGIEELGSGSGKLFDALQKIDIELVKQFNAARTTAEQIDVLARAYARLDKESQRVELARAAGGRAGASFGRLLTELQARGGVSGVTAGIPNIDKAAAQYDQIADKIALIKKDAADMLGRAFAPEILSVLTFTAEKMKDLAGFVERIAQGLRDLRGVTELTIRPETVNVPLPPQRPTGDISAALTNEQSLARLKVFVGLAGEAATASEQLAVKIREISKARDDGKITDEQATRAITAANLASAVSIQQTRERLGVATEQNIAETKLLQLRQDAATKGLTENEVLKARNLILREAKDAADQLAVRQAYLPGLKQLELDIARLDKEFDKFAVQSLSNIENAFVDLASSTKTLSEAFREMISSILKDLARLLLRQTITGPLAQLLGSLGGGGGGGFGLPITLGGNAAGTNNWGGGWTWVGEKGPELVNLPKGSQVVPNDVSRGGVGGVNVGVTSTIVVQGDASERTLMLIEGALARQKRELPNDIIKTVQQMKSRRSA